MGIFKRGSVGAPARKRYDLEQLKSDIPDIVSSAIMMVDRDFVVTYVNKPTMELLQTNADAFRKIWTSFDPEKIVGMCIDTFHKKPSHQRAILSDTSKLPFKTEITVGDLKIALNVSGSYDRKGNYVGNILEWRDVTTMRLNQGIITAVNRAQAVVEFSLDGHVHHANENFLGIAGYTLDEIKGRHHSMFVDPAERGTGAYEAFWQKLGCGEFDIGQYKRIGKGGREIWLHACYNPILDMNGRPFKVVEFATDITQQKMASADFEGQIAAINKAEAVISFSLDGKIIDANENFLRTLGYTIDEVRGRHHSMFVEPSYRESRDYHTFWEKLARGEYDAAQYKRIGKGGREVWIQASYNPIFDVNGNPFKVVKYATDVTAQVKASEALQLAVQQSQDVVGAAKENDLTKRVPMEGKTGEIAALCGGLNSLLDTVSDMVVRIRAGTLEVSNAAVEISASAADLSQRTEEQAAGLEETSASMEEISTTVKKNAENAQEANRLSAGTQEVADRGGAVVARAVEAMSRIEESSSRIADIIGVIDEIARQTNLLALNAAVEAARAGDAGRGFAVVASEVRSLAQRSSQAAKDIKDLITSSSSQVREGVELVNRAGESLNEIVCSIKSVAGIVADIARASNEQSVGIDQVNKALSQMDEVTQQNSALVEENAATVKTLENQARAMDGEVSKFSVREVVGKPQVVSTTAGARSIANSPSVAKSPAGAVVNVAGKLLLGRAKQPAAAPAPRISVGPMRIASAVKQEWEEF